MVGPPGSNCAAGAADGDCQSTVGIAVLSITKVADTAVTAPGGTVGYTVTITNSGTAGYLGATVTDDLSAVLDDATYNADAVATAIPQPTFTAPKLAWTGDVPAGGTVTITYSVTVNRPDAGDGSLTNSVVGPLGSSCATGSTDPLCTATVATANLQITKTATPSVTPVIAGTPITYTLEIVNTGTATYPAAAISDDLSAVLDDVTYNDDAIASSGPAPTFTSPTIAWTGDVAAGATVTITYSVTVDDPDTGDGVLANTVVGPPGSTCAPAVSSPQCTNTIAVAALQITKTASATSATPGDTITYTISVTNTGAGAFPGAAISDDLASVLDDASYNSDVTATSGTASFASPRLSWTGDVPSGEAVLITYSVTVNDPDAGDGSLHNTVVGPPGSNCAAGSADALCTSTVGIGSLDIAKTATPSSDPVVPGSKVVYTITIENTGSGDYLGASIHDDLSAVLDDATYDNDAAASPGSAPPTYAAPVLSWTDDVAAGQTVTITYSVTANAVGNGDATLANAVVGPPGSNCAPGPSTRRAAPPSARRCSASPRRPTAW